MDILRLKGMEFWGYHGVSTQERAMGLKIRVDAELKVDTKSAALSDNLADTIDYVMAYEMIRDIVEGQSFALLETLANKIAYTLLELPPINEVTVRVSKIPPTKGKFDRFEVEVTRARSS